MNAAITNLMPPTPVAGNPAGVAKPGPKAGAGERTPQGGQRHAAGPRDADSRTGTRRHTGKPNAHAVGTQPRRESGKPGRMTEAASLRTRRQPAPAGKGNARSAAHAAAVVVTQPGFSAVLRAVLAGGNPLVAAHADGQDAASVVKGKPGRVRSAVADIPHKATNKKAVLVQNSKTGPVEGKTDGPADAKAAPARKKPGAALNVLKQEGKGTVLPKSDAGIVGDKGAPAERGTGVRVPTDAEGPAAGTAQFLKIIDLRVANAIRRRRIAPQLRAKPGLAGYFRNANVNSSRRASMPVG